MRFAFRGHRGYFLCRDGDCIAHTSEGVSFEDLMVENPMNNAVIVRTQVTLSVDVVKFEAQDVITASSGVETPIDKEEQNNLNGAVGKDEENAVL